MSEMIQITIEKITCHKRSEFKGRKDNIYLKQAGGNKLWPQGEKAYNIKLRETIYPNYSHYYQPSGTITLELWEYDAGPGNDDFLGSVTYDKDSNGRHKQFMNGDGGQYEVIYNVENPNLKSPEKIESKTQPANAENSDLKSPEKIESNTPSAEELYYQANELKDAQKYAEAIALYDQALELEPEYVKALNNKGYALNDLGRYDEALEVLEKALQLKPDHYTAWITKSVVLSSLERYEEALSSCDKAISLTSELSNLSNYWDHKSSLLYELGRDQESIEASNKAFELNQSSPFLANNLYGQACCYALLKEDSFALANLRIAVELDKSYKDWAKEDSDFSHLYSDERFQAITKTEQTTQET
ncbi:MAG: tetratricopeptide repeat protein [Okeania sp. SIO2F4]|uniref:tetratricopeptide repeat protein n=1 Tax=Okeania sp. SIO2F4 TaxID=2607790 RepID=UPI00142A02DE|nr:tetratricopeptide repeat protein [Okeania sp. SIO2F4]NES06334.1 tetratricopeptide repeat protein [Okeania sp. SIO2F4]